MNFWIKNVIPKDTEIYIVVKIFVPRSCNSNAKKSKLNVVIIQADGQLINVAKDIKQKEVVFNYNKPTSSYTINIDHDGITLGCFKVDTVSSIIAQYSIVGKVPTEQEIQIIREQIGPSTFTLEDIIRVYNKHSGDIISVIMELSV